MSSFIFADTETTGIEEHDEVIQLAYVVSKDGKKTPMNKLYNPTVPISFKAMAVHNITKEMVSDKTTLDMNDVLMRGLAKMNTPDNYFVAHNAQFDIDMLGRHGFDLKMKTIDTLRCAKHLLDDAQGHSLGVIYYQYNLYKYMPELAKELGLDTGKLSAHDAMYDVMMLILATRMLVKVAGGDPEKLVELTQTPVLIKEFTFGKHKGSLVADVAKKDSSYLKWMLTGMEGLDEDMKFTINTYLDGAN